ncbi:hypothetical protein E6O75_ATG08329 [Venturia nashicola]|uniref:Uncharacterized protein n=1 Tax=Venturia nashicola TaxID=86259 RepID=A0A4Z1P0Z5_9PEZI|nr:hypothetical protein E6O75_ATG08329 [Venturia nashicola]
MRDAGLYHAMLSTVSLYMHGHLGIEARQDILFHETMKIIHERLANIDKPLSERPQPMINGIEPLRQLLQSKSPPPCLRRLIATSGGIAPYSANDALPCAIAWAEHHYAAAHRTIPPSRYEPNILPSPRFPECLELETAKTCQYFLIDIPEYGHAIYKILRCIHLLGIATQERWKGRDEMGVETRCAGGEGEGFSDLSRLDIGVDIVVTASQIFLFTALRSLPYLSRIVLAIQKLQQQPDQHSSIEQSNHLFTSWKQFAEYDALLWGLFMGMVAAMNRPGKDAIVAHLKEVVAMLGIESQERLEAHLKRMAWADIFKSHSKEVSKEIFRNRSIG